METDQSYRIAVHLADLQEIHGRLDHEGKKQGLEPIIWIPALLSH